MNVKVVCPFVGATLAYLLRASKWSAKTALVVGNEIEPAIWKKKKNSDYDENLHKCTLFLFVIKLINET